MRAQRVAFNGGELSDWLSPRLDLAKYHSGCERLRNMQVVRYGGARKRAGWLYVAEVKDSADTTRVEGFDFSRSVSVVTEWGDGYVRFYDAQAGTQEESGGSPYEVATPYGPDDVMALQFAQRNDVVIIVHPDYAPRILSRLGATSWTLTEIDWKRRAYEDANTTTTSMSVSATTGTGVTLTASAATFDSGWVGSRLKLTHTRAENQQVGSFDQAYYPRLYDDAADSSDDLQTFNASGGNYQVANATSGNPDRIRYDDGVDPLQFLYTTIADYANATDYVSGDDDPADYPSHFSPGIVVIEPIEVGGAWEFETTGTWSGEWKVQRSYDSGTNWETVRTCTSTSDKNYLVTDEEDPADPALFRVLATKANSSYNDPVYFRVKARPVQGVVLVTAYSSSTAVTVTVETEVETTNATQEWCEDSFSPRNGYPRAVGFHEERLWFAGTTAQPQKLWSSQTADYYNFETGTAATDALALTLASNRYQGIEWILSHRALLIGTTGGEWAMTTYEGAPVSPENAQIRMQSGEGSDPLPAAVVNSAVVHIQRQGRKVRELTGYGNEFGGYESIDLTQLAEHVTAGGVVQYVVRQTPDTTIDIVTGNGEIAGMVYERAEQVMAWHRWDTNGTVESIAKTYGAGEEDELWMVVNRTIDGATVRYIERQAPDMLRTEEDGPQEDLVFLDSAKIVTNDPASTTVSGLDHLEGETVAVLADGAVAPDAVVSSGAITLGAAASQIVVGLRYTAELRPMPEALSEKTQVASAWVRFRNTLTAEVYQDSGNVKEIDFSTRAGTGSPLALYTGDLKTTVPGKWARGQSLTVRSSSATPMTVVSIATETQAGRD